MRPVVLLLCFALVTCAAACSHPSQVAQPSSSQTTTAAPELELQDGSIEAAVREIVAHAQKGDIAYFHSLSRGGTGEQARLMVDYVNKSDMLETYAQRIKDRTSTSVRLDYHWDERRVYFQVKLRCSDGVWSVESINQCK